MDIWGILSAVGRRWYVALAVVLIGLGLALSLDRDRFAEYEVQGSLLKVDPAVSSPVVPNNPYVSSDGAEILAIQGTSNTSKKLLEAQGLSPDFAVENEERSPIMTIVAASNTEETTLATGQAVVDLLQATLKEEQDKLGVPPEEQATLRVIDAPDQVDQTAGAAQAIIAIAAVTGLLAIILSVAVDTLLARRKKTATGGSAAGGGAVS